MKRLLSPEVLAPWLWKIHARTLRPFFNHDERVFGFKNQEQATPEQFALIASVDWDPRKLPVAAHPDLYVQLSDSRWESLPFEGNDPEKIDKKFCQEMARHILNLIGPEHQEVSAEDLAPWLWRVIAGTLSPFFDRPELEHVFRPEKEMNRQQVKLCRSAKWSMAQLPPDKFPDLYAIEDHRWESLPERIDSGCQERFDKQFCRRLAEFVLNAK
jgi:hypothetical protein